MSSAGENLKNYSDDAKLLEFKSLGKVDSDNLSVAITGEEVNDNPQRESLPKPVMSTTNIEGEQEAWVAPFCDYDLEFDSVQSVCEKENYMSSKEGITTEHTTSMTSRDRLYDAAIKVKAVVKFTKIQKLKKRARWLTKKVIVFVLSHVGLTSLVGLYAVAGGFIFQRLERNFGTVNTGTTGTISKVAELSNLSFANINIETFRAMRNQHVDVMWNVTVDLNVLEEDKWKELANIEMEMFENNILRRILNEEYIRTKTTENSQTEAVDQPHAAEWTYSSALLFAVTVITTIGYGDTVPKSWEAKIVCIVYAVFGIPLTLLCLANIGSLLASVYRFTWKHASHLALILVRAPERNLPLVETSQVRVPISISVATMIVYILGGAAIFSEWENWTFLEGSYFCFITLSTIGFGDYVPGKASETLDSNAKRVVCALYLLFGLALLSMIFQLIQDSVTIVVGRYASFLGLSEAQIEKDILETCAEEERKKEAKELAEVKDKHSMVQLTKVVLEMGSQAGALHQGQVNDVGSINFQNGPQERFDEIARSAYNRHRAKSLPVPDRKTHRIMSRLQSVPEESVSRRNVSFWPDELRDLCKEDEEKSRDDLPNTHSLKSVTDSKNNLDG